MRKTSTILYTFEDMHGNAGTFNKQDFDKIVSTKKVTGYTILPLEGENATIKVPLLYGYEKPYDWAVTDEIGTEHYIYYEEV